MEVDFWLLTEFDKLAMDRCVRVQEGLARLREERDAAHAALCAAAAEDLPLSGDLWQRPEWPPEARERLDTFARLWDAFAIATAEFMCAHVCTEDRVYLRDPDIERQKARGRALYREISACLGEPYNTADFSRRFGLRRTPEEDALFWAVRDRVQEAGALARALDQLNAERGAQQLQRFADAYQGRGPLSGVMYAWWGANLF